MTDKVHAIINNNPCNLDEYEIHKLSPFLEDYDSGSNLKKIVDGAGCLVLAPIVGTVLVATATIGGAAYGGAFLINEIYEQTKRGVWALQGHKFKRERKIFPTYVKL